MLYKSEVTTPRTKQMNQTMVETTHIFPDELRHSLGQHEAGDGTAHDVEEGVHDPRAGGGFDWRAEGTAERAGSWTTAAADLRKSEYINTNSHCNATKAALDVFSFFFFKLFK